MGLCRFPIKYVGIPYDGDGSSILDLARSSEWLSFKTSFNQAMGVLAVNKGLGYTILPNYLEFAPASEVSGADEQMELLGGAPSDQMAPTG